MKKISLVAVAALASTAIMSSAASAATKEGFYLGMSGGAAYSKHKFDVDFYNTYQTSPADDTAGTTDVAEVDLANMTKKSDKISKSSGNAAFGISLGYDMGFLRAELGFNYSPKRLVEFAAKATGFTANDSSLAPAASLTNADLVMGMKNYISGYSANLNAFYDFKNSSNIVPYIGAGLGWSKNQVDSLGSVQYDGVTYAVNSTTTVAGGSVQKVHGASVNEKFSKSAMSYSLHLGASYAVFEDVSLDLKLTAQHANKMTLSKPLANLPEVPGGIAIAADAGGAGNNKFTSYAQATYGVEKKAMWTMGATVGLRATF